MKKATIGALVALTLFYTAVGLALLRHAYAETTFPPTAIDTSQFATQTQLSFVQSQIPSSGTIAANAPVQSVNGSQGVVLVPTVQRQVSSALSMSTGSVTWTFPTPFSHPPTCWPSVTSTATNTVFSQPAGPAASTTSVTVSMQAAATTINLLGLGLLTIWSVPPAGTTITLSCVGALP